MATKKQVTTSAAAKKPRSRASAPEQLQLTGLSAHTKKGLAAAGAWPAATTSEELRGVGGKMYPVKDLPGFKPGPYKLAFDPTKPVETRDGRKARILATDYRGEMGRGIVALVLDEQTGVEEAQTYDLHGRYLEGSTTTDDRDLVNVHVINTVSNVWCKLAGSQNLAPTELKVDVVLRDGLVWKINVPDLEGLRCLTST